MVFLVGLFFLVLAQARGWECGGDYSQEEEIPNHRRRLIVRSGSLAPIRIEFSYIKFDLGTKKLNTQFKEKIMPAVESFFKTSLKVYPVQGNLVLSSTTCIDINPIPNEHTTVGVEADIIIYITVENKIGQGYAAYAGFCERQGGGLGNVIAGRTVLNVPNVKTLTIGDNIAILTHEIFHILGFTSFGFKFWKNSAGFNYAANTLTKQIIIRGVAKFVMVSPAVQQKAMEVFACDTLEGIELEEYGGSNTAGSHWDRRIMMNDFMTGSVTMNPYWSTISLAALQDSGWYTVNYTLAMPPVFGKGSGCGFFYNKCVTNGVSSDPKLWCTTQNDLTCDIYSLNKGNCQVANYSSSLPGAYQYFSTPKLGGTDGLADYCPYRRANSDGNCRDGTNTKVLSLYNEVISPKSRCVSSTLTLIPEISKFSSYAACYEVVECSLNSAVLKIRNIKVTCPFTGGTVTITGYNGQLNCPNSDILCADVPCISMCYGRGVCKRGLCDCFEGFSGIDCSIICSAGCKTCDSKSCLTCKTGYFLVPPLTCNICSTNCIECKSASACSKCEAGYTLKNGFCRNICSSNCLACTSNVLCTTCDKGYYISSGGCVGCPVRCSACTSPSSCSSCVNGYELKSGACVLICPSFCQSCSSNTQCVSCNIGYYLSSSKTCIICESICKECTSATVCTVCKSGYELINQKCVIICPSNCTGCLSATVCSGCVGGFELKPNGNCVIICPLNCQSCSSNTLCDVCYRGFYLSSSKTCIICDSACSECESNTLCNGCKRGFYLSSSKTCIICDSTCSECTSATVCTVCKSGYYLIDQRCTIICSLFCLSCLSDNSCKECADGFFVVPTGCEKCDMFCKKCTSLTSCTVCEEGYDLVNGICTIICRSNCCVCNKGLICDLCCYGYFLSSNNCVKCDFSCKACSSISTCTECNTGYKLVSGNCLKCSEECKTCIDFNFCTSCNVGYVLIRGKCLII